MLARLDGRNLCLTDCRPPLVRRARAKHKGQKNRQGWRAGFEFLRLQPFLIVFDVVCTAKSSVSGLSFGHVDKLACGLCSNAFGAL